VSVTAKLAGFAVVLAVLFGAALVAGRAVHPLRAATPAAEDASEMAMGGDAVRGLAVSEGGLTLVLDRRTAAAGRPTPLAFRVVGSDGRTVHAFDVEHTKRMHLIVVRRDLSEFQHLHPVQAGDGRWTTTLALPAAGTYRVFADFSVDGTPHTLADDLQVDGSFRSQALPAPAAATDVDGLHVRLLAGESRAGVESELRFRVTRGGTPVKIDDYLGAKGHLVALRSGDLAFLHVHPDADRLQFASTFPTAGRYRLFVQFKVDGRVHTAAFTREVAR
jgi:hypothetical protein